MTHDGLQGKSAKRRGKNAHRLPVVKSSGLYVQAYGQGDDQRLARLLRDVWQRIPLGDRRRMVKYWRDNNPDTASVIVPVVELCPGLERADGVVGQANHEGWRLRFDADFFAFAQDAAVRGLIAHELGHVLRAATGQDCSPEEYETDLIGYQEDEIATNEIACRWGFGIEVYEDFYQACESYKPPPQTAPK